MDHECAFTDLTPGLRASACISTVGQCQVSTVDTMCYSFQRWDVGYERAWILPSAVSLMLCFSYYHALLVLELP